MAHRYCIAENWGKGFIEHNESAKFSPTGLPANIWRIPSANRDANLWVSKVGGTFKTTEEAQVILDAFISQAQTNFDAETETLKTQEPYISLSVEQKTQRDTQRSKQKPTSITLEE